MRRAGLLRQPVPSGEVEALVPCAWKARPPARLGEEALGSVFIFSPDEQAWPVENQEPVCPGKCQGPRGDAALAEGAVGFVSGRSVSQGGLCGTSAEPAVRCAALPVFQTLLPRCRFYGD